MMSVVGEPQFPASLLRRTANAEIDIHPRIPRRNPSSALICCKWEGCAWEGHLNQLKRCSNLNREARGLTIFLCPAYVRGEAYLTLHDGNADAAEFRSSSTTGEWWSTLPGAHWPACN